MEEDQKVSGTFAKRLKSQTLPTLPGSHPSLSRIPVAAAGFPLQQRKQMKHENGKSTRKTGHLSSVSYSVFDHQRGSGSAGASSSWLDCCCETWGLILCTLCRSCLVGTRKLRGICGANFQNTWPSWILSWKPRSPIHSACWVLGVANKPDLLWAQYTGRLLGVCTKRFWRVKCKWNQEHVDSISLEIHMCLEMKGAVSGQICFDLSDLKI